jgi:hypothetical protein
MIEEFTKLNKLGINDTEISKILGISKRHSSYLREKLKLPAQQIKRVYNSDADRIKGYIIRHIKNSARRRNLEFNLDYTDIDLPDVCPLLGIPLVYKQLNGINLYQKANYATLDRIDNSKGYIKGNVIILSRMANAMKNEANFEQLKIFYTNVQKLIDVYENQGALGNITDIFSHIKLKT